MSTNKIKISGKIVSIRDTGKKVEVTIKTTSKTIKGEYIKEYPIVVFKGDVADVVRRDFKMYDHVYIEGYVLTKAILTDEGRVYIQNLCGSSIEAKLVTNGDDFINEVEFKGIVNNINCPNNKVSVVRLEIEANEDVGAKIYPKVVGFGNAAEFIKNQVKENDVVYIKGYMQTNHGDKKNKNYFNESFIIREMAKTD